MNGVNERKEERDRKKGKIEVGQNLLTSDVKFKSRLIMIAAKGHDNTGDDKM